MEKLRLSFWEGKVDPNIRSSSVQVRRSKDQIERQKLRVMDQIIKIINPNKEDPPHEDQSILNLPKTERLICQDLIKLGIKFKIGWIE